MAIFSPCFLVRFNLFFVKAVFFLSTVTLHGFFSESVLAFNPLTCEAPQSAEAYECDLGPQYVTGWMYANTEQASQDPDFSNPRKLSGSFRYGSFEDVLNEKISSFPVQGRCSEISVINENPLADPDGWQTGSVWNDVQISKVKIVSLNALFTYANGSCGVPYTELLQVVGKRARGCNSPEWGESFDSSTNLSYCSRVRQARGQCLVGNPISLNARNKIQMEIDYNGGSLSFKRFYSSSTESRGNENQGSSSRMVMGWNWVHNYQRTMERRVSAVAGGVSSIVIHREFDSSGFVLQTDGSYRSTNKGVKDRLVGGDGSSWIYFPADEDFVEIYDATGLVQRRYSNGRGVSVSRVAGKISKVTDSFGRSISFEYDQSGRLSALISPGGDRTSYSYSEFPVSNVVGGQGGVGFNLSEVIFSNAHRHQFHYGEIGLTQGTYRPTALTGVSDSGVRYATYGYDSNGFASSTSLENNVSRFEVDSAGFSTPLGARFGIRKALTFDGVQNIFDVTQPIAPGVSQATTKNNFYDSLGVLRGERDFQGRLHCEQNDPVRGLELVRVEGMLGRSFCPTDVSAYSLGIDERKISTQWHPLWRLPVREAQPKKITTWVYNGQPDPSAGGAIASCAPVDAYVYDTVPIAVLCKQVEQPTTDANGGSGFTAASDGAARTWSYTWNRYGQMLTADGPRTDVSDVTTYEYYPDTSANWTQGDLKKITNALGQTWLFTKYDRAGRLLSMTDANNAVTQQTWTPRGWLETQNTLYALSTFSYYPTGLLKKLVRFDYSTLDFEYDAAHRLTSVTDTVGNRVEYTLDAAGNILQTDLFKPDLSLSRQQRIEFDALGRPWKQRNAAGQVTESRHDAMGRINKLIDAKNHVTDYQWDALGRLKEIDDAQQPDRGVTRAQFNGQDNLTSLTAPNSAATQFTVNGLGDVTQEVSSDRGTLNYTYDAAGNVTRRTDALGRVTDYTWDALNRLLSATFRPGVGATPTETINYTWDISANCQWGAGHLCRVTDGAGISEYSYTPFGHLVSDMRTEAGMTHRADFFKDARGLPMSSGDSTGLYMYPTRTGAGEILWVDFEFSSGELPQEGLRITGYDADGQMVGLAIGPRYELSDVLSSSRAFNLDGQVVDTLVIQSLVGLDLHWQTIYAPVGQPVSLTVTVSPLEARGMLLLCKDPLYYTSCDGDARLGEVAVTGGGVYTLQTFDTVPLGVYSASVRFVGAALVPSRYMYERQPIFIGVPPTSLIDDFLQ